MSMDSTPTPIQPKTSASKLPIKRKNPDPILLQPDPRPPPFKFHRIWTEPDEIRFLQGLLDCSSENLSFPRDLGIFYARFSNTMSQPYTKSQLSEKLRRLRKKFRVISTRLSKGLDQSQLSLHDRSLYDLSKRLWNPEFAATSPFNGARNPGGINNSNSNINNNINSASVREVERSSLFGIKVDFSPILPVTASGFDDNDLDFDDGVNLDLNLNCVKIETKKKNDELIKLSEVNVEFEVEDEEEKGNLVAGEVGIKADVEGKIGKLAGKVAMDVFDDCLKEARRRIGVGRESFRVRWQQQKIAELDAFGNRLRLVLESLQKQ